MNPEQKRELKENFYQPTIEREAKLIGFIDKLLNEQKESIIEIILSVIEGEDMSIQYIPLYQQRLLEKINKLLK